jgi:photosystem II stability/assembly factor-like uncharacterized protein
MFYLLGGNMNYLHDLLQILRWVFTTCLLVTIFFQGDFGWAEGSTSTLDPVGPIEANAVFPPTGRFVTHQFPGSNHITVTPNGVIYAYGSSNIYVSIDGGYLWSKMDINLLKKAEYWVLAPSPNFIQDHTFLLGQNTGPNALWISMDEGATWSLPAVSITGPVIALAYSPNYVNDRIIYMGTRTYSGPYLYRSNDGGQHWQGITYPGNVGVAKIEFSPNYVNDRTIYFLSDQNGLWSLTEAEQFELSIPIEESPDVVIKDFVISPNFAFDSILYVSTDVGLFLTNDGGNNWTYISPLFLYHLVISPDYAVSHMLLAGSSSGVMRSVDGGYNWENVLPGGLVSSFKFSPDFYSDSTIYASTSIGFAVSYDRGSVWQIRSPTISAPEHGLETILLSPNFLYDATLFIGPLPQEYGILYKSYDAGTNLELLPLPESGEPVFTLSGSYATDQTVFLAFYNRLYVSTNGGYDWTRLPDMPVYQAMILRTSPHYSIDQTIFMASYGFGVYRSIDGGISWQNITGSLPLYVDSLEISSGYPDGPTLFATVGDGVYRSDNGGDTWSLVGIPRFTSGMILVLSPSFPQDGTLFVGLSGISSGGVYRSTDRGVTWINVSHNFFPGYTTALAISPQFANDQTVIAAAASHPLYISEDAGENWFLLQGIPEGGRYGTAIGYDLSSKVIPIASLLNGVYRYVWTDFTPLEPELVQAFARDGDPQFITRQVSMNVVGANSPGIVLQESTDWLTITPISGTLPTQFDFTYDTSQLVDTLETTISADVYWSMHNIQHYSIPVTLYRAGGWVILPIIQR